MLADVAAGLYIKFVVSLKQGARQAPSQLSTQFLQLLDELDAVLDTSNHFSFGHWLSTAGSVAANANQHALYGFNARNLVTRWGPNGQIADYSSRLWSGLIRSYYKQRWKIALESTVKAWRPGVEVSDQGFQQQLTRFEEQWQDRGLELEPVTLNLVVGVGKIVPEVQRLYGKYQALSLEVCGMLN